MELVALDSGIDLRLVLDLGLVGIDSGLFMKLVDLEQPTRT